MTTHRDSARRAEHLALDRPRLRRTAIAIGAVSVLGFGLTACGSDDSTSTAKSASSTGSSAAGVTEAKQIVAGARNQPSWQEPGPSFDASAAKGKLVYDIASNLSLGFTQALVAGTKAGLTAAGAQVQVVDSKADVSNAARLIQQAIGRKADAIIIQAVKTDAIAAPLAAAKKAGIPVITVFDTDPGLPSAEDQARGVVGQATFSFSSAGKLIADWTIADSDGKANAVSFWNPDVGSAPAQNDGQQGEFKRLAPSAKVKYTEFQSSQWSTQLPTLTSAAVKDPSVNYLLPAYDEMTNFIVPSLAAANATSRVKIVSFNANADILERLAKKDSVAADVGSPNGWMGWGVADQTLRAITGTAPIADEKIPLRIFDATNIASIDTKGQEKDWYGVDYESEYKKLWGVG